MYLSQTRFTAIADTEWTPDGDLRIWTTSQDLLVLDAASVDVLVETIIKHRLDDLTPASARS